MLYAEPSLGQIVAVVQERVAQPGTPGAVRAAAQTAGLSSPNVKVEVTPDAMSDAANVYGGSALDNCTVGFTAKRGSEVGFVTAAHCSTPRQYWSTPTDWTGACPSGHCNGAFVSVNASQVGGDSGGPWFAGRWAPSTRWALYPPRWSSR